MSSAAAPHGRASCAVVVMAKAPLPGYAKTRLVPALGEAGAARLAGRLLAHAMAVALESGVGPVLLSAAPCASHAAFSAWVADPRVWRVDQVEGDLGARMAAAFEQAFARAAHVLLMGTDAPALDAAMLRRAAAGLRHHDAVFVPALDGGYVLVGLARPQPALFAGMRWSTPQVMADTRARLAALGLTAAEAPAVADIDEPADLVHLPAGWPV